MGKAINGRSKTKSFTMLRHDVLKSPQFAALSYKAVKLLVQVMGQYNGSNNGDLCVTMSVMREQGWTSSGTLQAAKDELVEKGWLELTRQGGRHKCSLYALSVFAIDECGGKHDRLSTSKSSELWKRGN